MKDPDMVKVLCEIRDELRSINEKLLGKGI